MPIIRTFIQYIYTVRLYMRNVLFTGLVSICPSYVHSYSVYIQYVCTCAMYYSQGLLVHAHHTFIQCIYVQYVCTCTMYYSQDLLVHAHLTFIQCIYVQYICTCTMYYSQDLLVHAHLTFMQCIYSRFVHAQCIVYALTFAGLNFHGSQIVAISRMQSLSL